MYTGNIINIFNVENTRELIQELSGISLEKPLVIDDISLLYRSTILLKFIEESKLKLILLASKDNLSSTLLSRIKTIKKYPDESNTSFNLTSIKDAEKHIKSEELNQDDTINYLATTCPELIVLNKKLRYIKNKDKILDIYSNI